MPSSAEIQRISESFAAQYGVDLVALNRDFQNLQKLLNSKSLTAEPLKLRKIYSDSSAITAPTARQVADLETFGFEEVAVDPILQPHRVEQNLDEAVRYADNCLQARRQYIEMAKLRNDARFKFEEFVRLDLVHQDEVKAGLYELPWNEAEAEKEALEISIREAKVQKGIVDEMFTEGATEHDYSALLTAASVKAYSDSSATITRHTANTEKDTVENESKKATAYRSGIEKASWLQNRSTSTGNVLQLSKRFGAAEKKAAYLKLDAGFRGHRAAISRQLAWLQIDEHSRKDSVLNYNERLENQRKIFNKNLGFLVQRALPLESGLKECYGIEFPVPRPPKNRVLDELASWLVDVQDIVSKHKRQQKISIFSRDFAATTAKLDDGKSILSTAVTVNESELPTPQALLRGIAFEFLGSHFSPVTFKVKLPANATTLSASSAKDFELTFGRVSAFTPAFEIGPQFADCIWNGSPQGTWDVSCTFDEAHGTIERVIMHLWLATI